MSHWLTPMNTCIRDLNFVDCIIDRQQYIVESMCIIDVCDINDISRVEWMYMIHTIYLECLKCTKPAAFHCYILPVTPLKGIWIISPGAYVPMMTSSNGNAVRVTGPCAGNSPATGEFPSQRPVTRSFQVIRGFDLRLNKRLSKQSWFDTSSPSLWRYGNALNYNMSYIYTMIMVACFERYICNVL